MSNSSLLDSCLICGSKSLTNYLNLEEQPPANSYCEVPTDLPTFPLRLNYCSTCCHSQLSHVVDPSILFRNYLYVSGTTRTLDKHFSDYVSFVLSGADKKLSVLEIGSNDGTLLAKFKEQGCFTLGIDPAENLLPLSREKGVDTEVAFWNKETAKSLWTTFDVIVANNVLAHNLNPVEFLEACKSVLNPEGRIYLEFPLFTNTVKILDIGQVYHEHINYFTLASLAVLMSRVGLEIIDVQEFPDIHGGTLRLALKSGKGVCEKFENMLKTEKLQGFHQLGAYEKFAEDVTENLLNVIKCVRLQTSFFGYKVIGYGAAAKASTILNALKGALHLEYIVDNNELKVGRVMPGVATPIVPFSKLEEEKEPLLVVIFPGNFKTEIKERLRTVLGKQCCVLNITPTAFLEDLYDE